MVRLGEHDTRIMTDGEHQDIPVADEEPHEDFSMYRQINDIAVVYLERDVVFNGEKKYLTLSLINFNVC